MQALAGWQREQIRGRGLTDLLLEVELPLVRVLRAMELAGSKLDTDRLQEISNRVKSEADALEREIFELAGTEFMLGSPRQLEEVLFGKLGLSRKRRGKTGYSTDARVLQAIRHEHPVIPKIERWRELTKLAQTYLDALPQLLGADGRLHTTFNQTAATTGRLSSNNPNLQNIPIRTELGREIRSCFVAEQGNLLVSADYSQVELRLLAHIAGEDVLKDIFRRREDVHTATACRVFGVTPEQIDPGMRSKAKMINYGIVYGLSAWGMADRLDIPQEEADEFIQRYLAGFPAVARWIEETIAAGNRARLRLDAVRPPPPGSGAARPPLGAAQTGGAIRGQHGDSGDGGRHHEGGHGPLRSRAERRGAPDAIDPPNPRRTALRGPGRRGRAGQGDRVRRDAGRVRHGPAAGGRGRGRPRLVEGEVSARVRRDALLVCLTLSSGAVDAISYLGLGKVFTANMTGNIVLLGLAVGRSEGSQVVRAAISLVAYAAGAFLASRIARRGEDQSIWRREVTLVLALEALLQAGLFAAWLASSGHPGQTAEALMVGLSALAMGIQSAAVAALGVAGVTTTYVTGTLTGLMGGLGAGSGNRSELARRAIVLVALLAGAAIAAVILTNVRRLAPLLPLLLTGAVVVYAATRWRAAEPAAAANRG